MGTFAVARTIAGGNPPVIPVDHATGAVSVDEIQHAQDIDVDFHVMPLAEVMAGLDTYEDRENKAKRQS
jgi:hypothetical protein